MPRQTVPQIGKSSERRIDVRYVGPVHGCFSLSERREISAEGGTVFACRTLSLSPSEIVLATETTGTVGETITAYFDGFGIIRGQVQRQTLGGFAFDVTADLSARERLAGKIEWLKLKSVRKQTDHRAHRRFQPKDPRSTLALPDGTMIKCFVIDLSRGGAGICTHLRPEIGTAIRLGRVVGRVIRHFEVGFAMQFRDELDPDQVEPLAMGYIPADVQK